MTDYTPLLVALILAGVIIVLSAINGVLRRQHRAPGLVAFLDALLDALSVTQRYDSPGTLKPPLVRSAAPATPAEEVAAAVRERLATAITSPRVRAAIAGGRAAVRADGHIVQIDEITTPAGPRAVNLVLPFVLLGLLGVSACAPGSGQVALNTARSIATDCAAPAIREALGDVVAFLVAALADGTAGDPAGWMRVGSQLAATHGAGLVVCAVGRLASAFEHARGGEVAARGLVLPGGETLRVQDGPAPQSWVEAGVTWMVAHPEAWAR